MKPGNSMEEKTLTIRKGDQYPSPGYLEHVIGIGEAVDERWQ